MKSQKIYFKVFLLLILAPAIARADIDNAGILDNVLNRYSLAASGWATTITAHATGLFWTLTLISMVWTFGMMLLRKADIAEFFAEFMRFTIFTGFFWWLLINGPKFAISIMDSLRKIGENAAGINSTLSPSGIVDIGFDIFAKVLVKSSVWSPFTSAVGIAISLIILIVLALIGVNMLLLLISAWILAYAGIFFLGFGGARWTSDMAINYFKTVLSIGAQLFAMVLLVGIGKSFIDQFYSNVSAGMNLNELAVILVVAIILLALVTKVPGLIGGLATGGGTGALGAGFGAGTALGAAAMSAAAAATAGAAAVSAATNIAGGTQALMAAFSKANAAESAGGGANAFMDGSQGNPSSGKDRSGGAALSEAMGDTGQTSPSASVSANGNRQSANRADQSGASEGRQQNSAAAKSNTSDTKNDQKQTSSHTGTSSSEPKETKSSRGSSTIPDMDRMQRIAAGTAANLAKGAWDMTKDKASEMMETTRKRISETPGGKLAARIASEDASANQTAGKKSAFEEDSISPGTADSANADEEVAAFRDRDPKPS